MVVIVIGTPSTLTSTTNRAPVRLSEVTVARSPASGATPTRADLPSSYLVMTNVHGTGRGRGSARLRPGQGRARAPRLRCREAVSSLAWKGGP